MKIKTWVERVPTHNMELSMPPRQHYRDEWHAQLKEDGEYPNTYSATGPTEESVIEEVKAQYRAYKKGRTIEWDGK